MPEMNLRRVVIICAVIQLFGMAGDQTTWIRGRGQTITDGAIYNLVAVLCGIIALIGIVVVLNWWQRLLIPLVGFLMTMGAFGLTILVAGVSVRAQVEGEVWFYGAARHFGDLGNVAGDTFGSATVVDPAQAPFLFTAVAAVGAVATLGLAGVWASQARQSRASTGLIECLAHRQNDHRIGYLNLHFVNGAHLRLVLPVLGIVRRTTSFYWL